MKQIIYQNSKIFAATTLKDTAALEKQQYGFARVHRSRKSYGKP